MIFFGSYLFRQNQFVEIDRRATPDQARELIERGHQFAIICRTLEDLLDIDYHKLFGDNIRCFIFKFDSFDVGLLKKVLEVTSTFETKVAFDFKDDKWYNADTRKMITKNNKYTVVMNVVPKIKMKTLICSDWFYIRMFDSNMYTHEWYTHIRDCIKSVYPDAFKLVNRESFVFLTAKKDIYNMWNDETVVSFRLPRSGRGERLFSNHSKQQRQALVHTMTKLDKYNDPKSKFYQTWGNIERWFVSYYDVRKTLERHYGAHYATNGWRKCWELLTYYDNFVPTNGKFTYFDNAAFHGSFILATHHYYVTHYTGDLPLNFDWYASSLISNDRVNPLDDKYELWKRNPERWLMGDGMDGDVTKVETLQHFESKIGGKVDLYTSDLGFGVEDYNKQEEEHAHANLGQICAGLFTLKEGGNMITKQYTYYTGFTVSLISLVTQCFKHVEIVKPDTSKPDNSEVYIVGIEFVKVTPELKEILLSKLSNFDLSPLNIPAPSREFMDIIVMSQRHYTLKQIYELERNITDYHNVIDNLRGNTHWRRVKDFAQRKRLEERNKDISKWFRVNKPLVLDQSLEIRTDENIAKYKLIVDKKVNEKIKLMQRSRCREQCYKTAQTMLDMLGSNISESEFILEGNNSVSGMFGKMPDNMIAKVEIHIKSSDIVKPRNLGKLTNFVFKGNEVRLFIHSFNIISSGGNIIISQSWFREQTYNIVSKFPRNLLDTWIAELSYNLENFADNPKLLHKFFKHEGENDYHLLSNMIKTDIKNINIKILISRGELS